MGEGDEIVQVFRAVTRIIISTPRMSYQHTHTLLLLPACGSGYTLLDWAQPSLLPHVANYRIPDL